MNTMIMDMTMPPGIMQELLGWSQNFDVLIECLYEDKIEEKWQGSRNILIIWSRPIMMNVML